MKLLTIKQLKNGRYRDINLDKTITTFVMKLYLAISPLAYMIYVIVFQPSKIMSAIVVISLIISYFLMYPIGYYFMCCETYISECEVEDA